MGTCPSAGGARAPLARIVSHMQMDISRPTVCLDFKGVLLIRTGEFTPP